MCFGTTAGEPTLDELARYAALAEIFGALTIVGGGMFAAFQITEYRRRRASQVAADLCRGFTEPELARAVTLLRSLPDGLGLSAVRERGPEYEEAMQIVGMTFETMGLLVHKKIASFTIVQELAGGLLLMMWRKMEVWARDVRVDQGNPRFGEWVQWLAERVDEREGDLQPAYEAHADWREPR